MEIVILKKNWKLRRCALLIVAGRILVYKFFFGEQGAPNGAY